MQPVLLSIPILNRILGIFNYFILLLFQMYGQQYDYNRQMTGYPGYGAAYYHR